MMRIVIREAQSAEDLAAFLDRDLLIEHWTALGLPRYIAAAWEERFPELQSLLDPAFSQQSENAAHAKGHAPRSRLDD